MKDDAPYFVKQYGNSMSRFLGKVYSYTPNIVIAITRKGPRLLELCEKFQIGNTIGLNVMSEKSLPFLNRSSLEGKRVVVLDDIAIYGSTLKDVTDQIRNVGADVFPITLAIDRTWLNRELADPEHEEDLDPNEVETFNRSLVRAFQSLGKPYDVDHPIITLDAVMRPKQECLQKIQRLGKKAFDLTSPTHDRFGLINLTIDDPYGVNLETPLNSDCVLTVDGVRKIRIIADTKNNIVRVVPMTTFTLNVGMLKQGTNLFVEELSDLNALFDNLLQLVTSDICSLSLVNKAIYRAALYLSAYTYGRTFLKHYGENLGLPPLSRDGSGLNNIDTSILFNPIIAEWLEGSLSAIDWDNVADLLNNTTTKRVVTGYRSERRTPELAQTISKAVDQPLYEKVKEHLDSAIVPGQDLVTNFNSIFRQLYLFVDLEQRQHHLYEPERLSFGFTYNFVKYLLKSHRVKFNDWHLSACLDYSVDCGSVVPIVALSSGDVCCRAYRFGETKFAIGPDELRYMTATLTEHLISVYNKVFNRSSVTISRTIFEKVFAFIGGHLDRVMNPEFQDINLVPEFHRHGVRLRIVNKLESIWFADWCQQNSIITTATEGGPYQFNTAFYEQYPRLGNPLPRYFTSDLKSLVTLLVTVMKRTDDPAHEYQTLLAITSCNSERNLIKGVRKDLELWFGYGTRGSRAMLGQFIEILSEARKYPREFEADLIDSEKKYKRLRNTVYNDATNLTELSGECRHKFTVFRSLPEIKGKLETLFSGNSDLAEPLGDQYERFFFDVFDLNKYPNNNVACSRLQRLTELCDTLGWVFRSFIAEELLRHKQGAERRHSFRRDLAEFEKLRQEFIISEPLFSLTELIPTTAVNQKRVETLRMLCQQGNAIVNELQNFYELSSAEIQIPLMRTVQDDECAVNFDIRDSSDDPSKDKTAAIKLALKSQVSQYIRVELREKDTDDRPNADDSGMYVLRNPSNAIKAGLFIRDRSQALGMQVRVGVYYTKGREKLYQTITNGTKGGGPFETVSRLMTYYKDQKLEKEGESYIFINGELALYLRQAKDNILRKFKFRRLGLLSPRGKGLPNIEVYLVV